MRFIDFLRTAVLLFGASATVLGAVTVVGATSKGEDTLVYFTLAWWLVATVTGILLGRRARVTDGISRMLAGARSTPVLPEVEPGRILLTRLWALAALTVGGGAVAFVIPQVPAVGAGYALIGALAWRRQSAAVLAIEQRDGVQFYVEPTGPFEPTKLLRVPGYRKLISLREPARRPGAPV
ncbi:MAG TPA: hypothetical protein VGF74_08310 [Thermoleophilaceae bacterium]|jgi:hypothetical protein